MELTSDLIALQGILSSLIKTTGEFKKINFPGGNEEKILDIIAEIHKFLSSLDGKENKLDCRVYNKRLENIVIFLALNVNFTHSFELTEYSHLMNITPPFSKCLFINVLCGLELTRYLCSVINIFPMKCSTELLEEIVPCLRKMPPKDHLNYACMILKAAASKLASVESEDDNLSDITNIILRDMAGINSNQLRDWKATQIYQHMAYCLLDLFELLLFCDKSRPSQQKFIKNVITTCCLVVKNITIKIFCSWVELLYSIFPIKCSTELLEEIVPCLRKMPPKDHLNYACMILKAAASKLASVESEDDNLSDITNIILRDMAGINSNQLKDWKATQIYQHMAYCLLDLFELLLFCDKSRPSQQKFIKNVITTCCLVVKNITIKIFCSWVEIREEDGDLQTLVSNKAYSVIENCQKYPEAGELVSMLSSIARKPLILAEQIHLADVETMIRKINKNDKDQKSWFQALLETKKFSNDDVMNCLSCYYYLCREEDVNLLLNCYVESNDARVKTLAKNVAASLSLDKLILVATRHFYRNKFKHDIGFESTLDKIKQDDDMENELPKKIILSMLDSPEKTMKYIYTQCLKSSFYTDCLRITFSSIGEIAKIDNIGVATLLCVLDENPPNFQNIDNFVVLFRTLIETEYFCGKILAAKILDPLIRRFNEAKCVEELGFMLEITKRCDIVISVSNEFEDFIKLLLTIMNECRCRFLKFDGSKQMVVKHIVDIFCDMCQFKIGSEVDLTIENEDCYTNYYRQQLNSSIKSSMFESLCQDFAISNYGNCVHQMIQILPPLVAREWLLFAREIIQVSGHEKCLELFTDVLVLLSQVVETQNSESLYSSLKHCLHNYGSVVQHEIHRSSTMEIEANVNKQICRLLAKLPEAIKEEQGLLLINVMTDDSLKSLANDKEFLCHLILIKNSKICSVLAQKISQ